MNLSRMLHLGSPGLCLISLKKRVSRMSTEERLPPGCPEPAS